MYMQDDREGLLNFLVADVAQLVRKAGVANSATAAALLGEAQELLAIHAGILRRRQAAIDVSEQLALPFAKAA